MKDSDLRALVLKKFYEERKKDKYFPKAEDFPEVDIDDIYRVCSQLAEHNLLKAWQAIGRPVSNGNGIISADGVDVIEGTKKPSIAISVTNNNQSISVGNISKASNLTIGNDNTVSIESNLKEIIEMLKSSDSSKEEKEAALTLLKGFISHPLVASMAGASLSLL
mgnify:CR=1 FL=1